MRRILGLTLIGLLSAVTAWADNTTAFGAYSIMPGGTPAEAFLDSTATERWYAFGVLDGRSYCAETQGGVHFDSDPSAFFIDTVLTIFHQNSTTTIVSNDDTDTEPFASTLSRTCFIANTTELAYIKVTRAFSTDSFAFRLRVTETTLYSNWFFLGGDYNAFTLVRNTSVTPLSYTINYRNSSGNIVGTRSGSLAGNGSVTISAQSFPNAVAAGSGTVEIVHDGSPDSIMATTTVLSPTTGLSFDTIFEKRNGW